MSHLVCHWSEGYGASDVGSATGVLCSRVYEQQSLWFQWGIRLRCCHIVHYRPVSVVAADGGEREIETFSTLPAQLLQFVADTYLRLSALFHSRFQPPQESHHRYAVEHHRLMETLYLLLVLHSLECHHGACGIHGMLLHLIIYRVAGGLWVYEHPAVCLRYGAKEFAVGLHVHVCLIQQRLGIGIQHAVGKECGIIQRYEQIAYKHRRHLHVATPQVQCPCYAHQVGQYVCIAVLLPHHLTNAVQFATHTLAYPLTFHTVYGV